MPTILSGDNRPIYEHPVELLQNLIRIDTTNPPECKMAENQSFTTFDPGLLGYTTMYYWQIVAWDRLGNNTIGPIWNFTTMRENNLALLSENMAALDNIESMIKQAEEKAKPAQPDTYTVVRGDFLWRIAGKNDIYGDPYAWSRIYTSNRDQIKDPDLIFPAQIFAIPRDVGPNEHLVVKGEFLSKIAGYSNVYGSPFKWQKIYEANKEVVEDPNVVYPYQVLNIPRD